MSKELEEELTHVKEKLQDVNMESCVLPSDIMIAYDTGRPELLRLVKRPLTQEETIAVLDAMAGLLEITTLQKRVISVMTEQRAETRDQILEVLRAVRNLSS